ncbi:hypothetical protein ES708_08944 [subsurface metagenome]
MLNKSAPAAFFPLFSSGHFVRNSIELRLQLVHHRILRSRAGGSSLMLEAKASCKHVNIERRQVS